MIAWLKRFFFDETAFTAYVRLFLMAFGLAWESGAFKSVIAPEYQWVGILVAGLAVFVRAGEKNVKVLVVLLALLLPGLAQAAGSSVTWTRTQYQATNTSKVNFYQASIVSDDAAGTASGATVMHGYIVRIVTNPGSAAPDDNWDCVLNDADGVDVLGGALANRDTTNTEQAFPLDAAGLSVFARVDGSLTLSCSGMGNSKTAVVRAYVQE